MKGLARQGVAKVKDASEAEMFCSNFWSIGPLVFEGVHVGSIVLFELKTLNLGAFFYLCTRHCGFFSYRSPQILSKPYLAFAITHIQFQVLTKQHHS